MPINLSKFLPAKFTPCWNYKRELFCKF